MIYNFFEDSPANLGQWRLVTQDGLNNFDPIKHAILCTELKILYVAITRARHTVQIVDESPKGYPMQEYWSSRDLIAVGVPGPKSVRRQSNQLGATRINYGQLDGKELVRRGQEFFNRGLYEDAEQCFIRAGKQSKAQIARAYVLKSIADHSSDRGRGLQIQFLKAGDAFEALAKAGIGQSQEYWRVAGVCFYKAGNFEKAVCIWYYGRLFDQALACIMENASQISMEITEQVLKEARRVYFSNGDFRQALKTFPNPSADRALEWLDLQDWIDTKIQLLVHLGRFSAAAIIHKTGGRSYEAIALWMKEYKECPNSARQAAAEITLYIRQLYGFKNWAKVDTTIAHQLLEWIGELESSRLNLLKGSTEILSIFKRHMASASENADQTQFLSQIHTRDQICFLLAMSHYCKSIPSWEHSIDWQTLVQRLHIFLEYLTELSQLAHGSLESAAKVFGFILESSGAIHIPRGTFLFDAMQPLPKNGMLQSRDDFRERLVNVISNYIVELAIAQDAWCRKVPLLQIQNCIYTMSTDFTSSACSLHSEHLDSGGIYRWKAYAYQLGIANMMNSQTNRNVEVYQTEENPITMYWFKRLACAFNPILGCHTPHLPLGGMQARKVQEYHRFVNEVGPPSFTIDGKKHAFGHALYSYLKRAANQSLWAMRSIWTAHSTVEGYTLWTPSRVELFSSYIERLTMALVIRYRCGDLEDLELPDLWITEEIWDFAERNSTDTGEELIDEALVEALELTCRMIIRASEYIDAVETSVMARLYAVVYILATETGLWSIVRYTLLGETAPLSRTRFEDDYSAMRLVQSRFEPFIYIVKVGSSWVEHLESLSASTDPKLESDADGSPTYDDSLTHDDHHDSESDDSFGDGQWQ
ncbi:hypothetical protein AX16_000587 [Volvariella volvacea WC 439]|nr:hypothetical protein AX16_000587 [Volvariella volvacea WC 439]